MSALIVGRGNLGGRVRGELVRRGELGYGIVRSAGRTGEIARLGN